MSKLFNFTALLTLLIVLAMQVATVAGVMNGSLSIKDYAAIWMPILTLVMGYWFRGNQSQEAAP